MSKKLKRYVINFIFDGNCEIVLKGKDPYDAMNRLGVGKETHNKDNIALIKKYGQVVSFMASSYRDADDENDTEHFIYN